MRGKEGSQGTKPTFAQNHKCCSRASEQATSGSYLFKLSRCWKLLGANNDDDDDRRCLLLRQLQLRLYCRNRYHQLQMNTLTGLTIFSIDEATERRSGGRMNLFVRSLAWLSFRRSIDRKTERRSIFLRLLDSGSQWLMTHM